MIAAAGLKFVHGWAMPASDQFMSRELHEDGTYQASHYRIGLAHVTDRSLAVDCGAHVGTWSRLMSRDFQRVIAVEPCPETFEALHWNMQQQGCANVELKHLAVGATAGLVSMILDGRGALLANSGARRVGKGEDVRVEPIDAWELPSLGFLKMDIEGSEIDALHGAKETIKRCQPVILYEDKYLWKAYGYPRNAAETFLKTLRYRELDRASMDRIWGPA